MIALLTRSAVRIPPDPSIEREDGRIKAGEP